LAFVQAAYEETHESSQVEYVTGTKKLHGMMVDQEIVPHSSKNHIGVSPLPHHIQNVQQSQPE
jgi:hypothetical protein